MDSELSPIGYHHQHIEPNGNRKFQEIPTGNSYTHQTHPQVSYNPTSSDFSVSNRLLNTQQVHPKPYSFIDNNSYPLNYMNYSYSTNNGWHLPPTDQIGTIRHQSPRYEPPPPNQTVYQLQNTQSHQSVLPKYEHHHFTTVPPLGQNNTLSHASPSPAQHCDHSSLQASSPSNLSWNSIGYPYSNDNGVSTLDNSINDSPPKNGSQFSYSTSSIPEPVPLIFARPDHSPSSINGNSNDNNVIMNRPNCEEDEDSDSRSIIESDTSDHKKPKRTRTAFTSTQLDQLEIYFSDSIYPDAFVRDDISKQLHIKEDRIQVWFQNRRARYRKQERTGSVSIRSKARQQRVERIKETQQAAASRIYTLPPQSNYAMYPATNPQSFSRQFTFQLMTDPTPRSPVVTTSSPLQSTRGYPFTISNDALLPHQPALHNPPPVMLNGHSSSYGASLDK